VKWSILALNIPKLCHTYNPSAWAFALVSAEKTTLEGVVRSTKVVSSPEQAVADRRQDIVELVMRRRG
jgi:hypothetical protein